MCAAHCEGPSQLHPGPDCGQAQAFSLQCPEARMAAPVMRQWHLRHESLQRNLPGGFPPRPRRQGRQDCSS